MELVDALKVLEATDGETRKAFLCLWDDYCHIVSHDKWATDVAYAKVRQLDGLKSEFEAARAVCFAIEKYIMMPTQDDNGNLIDDGAEWDAIVAALSEWAKIRDLSQPP